MSTESESFDKVVKNIKDIYNRKRASVAALGELYGRRALDEFISRQNRNFYWKNQTNDAKNTVFTSTDIKSSSVSWGLAHRMIYGIYLELCNDRKHAALQPIMRQYGILFKRELEKLFNDG